MSERALQERFAKIRDVERTAFTKWNELNDELATLRNRTTAVRTEMSRWQATAADAEADEISMLETLIRNGWTRDRVERVFGEYAVLALEANGALGA